ncbi:MAG: hypothetical protein ABR913_08595 [Sedimentisphaerales bacterium]
MRKGGESEIKPLFLVLYLPIPTNTPKALAAAGEPLSSIGV